MCPSMQDEPSRPVAIVTGAGSGIGRAIAVGLAEDGVCIVAAGRRIEAIDETCLRLRLPAMSRPTDVSDFADIEGLIDETIVVYGRIDILVNCAGQAPLAAIDHTTPGLLEQVYRVNALGPAYAIARVWPIMVKQGRGCIINITSMATTDPFPGFFMYAGAKGACEAMVKSCAREGKPHGIRAFAVAPGAVETAMLRRNFDESIVPPSRCLRPEDIAGVVADCVSGKRDAENGQTIYVASS